MKSSKAYLLLLIVFLLSCSNDDFQIDEVDGIIVDVSTIAGLESCGFMIRIQGELYKPTYLNTQYEQDGLEVLLKVEFLATRANCGSLATPPREIRMEQMRPSI